KRAHVPPNKRPQPTIGSTSGESVIRNAFSQATPPPRRAHPSQRKIARIMTSAMNSCGLIASRFMVRPSTDGSDRPPVGPHFRSAITAPNHRAFGEAGLAEPASAERSLSDSQHVVKCQPAFLGLRI